MQHPQTVTGHFSQYKGQKHILQRKGIQLLWAQFVFMQLVDEHFVILQHHFAGSQAEYHSPLPHLKIPDNTSNMRPLA